MLDVMMFMVVVVMPVMMRRLRKGRIGKEECHRSESCNVEFGHMNHSKFQTSVAYYRIVFLAKCCATHTLRRLQLQAW